MGARVSVGVSLKMYFGHKRTLEWVQAVAAICETGARAIVVLGGDGTHRVVARACGDVPICALSTGTNNAFPEWRETTVAGLATGFYVTGRGGPDALGRLPDFSDDEMTAVIERHVRSGPRA